MTLRLNYEMEQENSRLPLTLLCFFSLTLLIISGLRWYLSSGAVRFDLDEEPSPNSIGEINGGYLPRSNSVFCHLKEGLSRSQDGWAVICLHQQADHLADVITPSKSDRGFRHDGKEEKSAYGPNGCLAITYEQLDCTAQRLAAGLLSAGVHSESNMLMFIPNGVEYALLVWCCVLLRITYVCADPETFGVSGFQGLKDIMRSVKPSVVVTAGAMQAAIVDIAIEDLNLLPPVRISLDGTVPKGWLSFKSFIAHTAATKITDIVRAAEHDNPNRINSIIFTSGTSGLPKGCPLRVASMCQILESQSWLINQNNCARALQAAHNSRGIAAFQTLQTWKAGGAVVMIAHSCDIKEMTEALRYHAPTFIAVSPSMASAIREETKNYPFMPDSVRTVQVGGEAVTVDAVAQCSALFPRAKVCVNHGMTEGGGSFQWPFFATSLDEIPRFGELCPIGIVSPGSAVRIWDASSRRPVKRGEVGELHIRGGSLLRQYMNGRSPESFFDDEKGHWLVTGDTAMIDRNGLIFILGRSRDMIVGSAGIIVPAAIETVIQKYLGVQVSMKTSR
jgi:acyl-CoA synthetase (AMP-forming)/AMP-acid ligase II